MRYTCPECKKTAEHCNCEYGAEQIFAETKRADALVRGQLCTELLDAV